MIAMRAKERRQRRNKKFLTHRAIVQRTCNNVTFQETSTKYKCECVTSYKIIRHFCIHTEAKQNMCIGCYW